MTYTSRTRSWGNWLIIFDQRTGMSDPIPFTDPPTLEVRMDDIAGVMGAASSERTAVLGSSGGGALAAMFAGMHPERTTALVLLNARARSTKAADYPLGIFAVRD